MRWLRTCLVAGLVAGLVVVALLGAACGDDDHDARPADPSATPIDPAALLERAAVRMEGVEAFRFELTHENGTSEIVRGIQMERAEGAVAGPDRLEVQIEGRFLAFNIDTGVVILPDQSWLLSPITGDWEREDVNIDAFFDPANGVTALMRSIVSAELAGEDRIDGVDTVRLLTSIDAGALTLFGEHTLVGESVIAEVWIGVDDPLVYRLELRGPVLSGDGDDIERRLELRDFDGEIKIEAPR
jgi:hypothetical protein